MTFWKTAKKTSALASLHYCMSLRTIMLKGSATVSSSRSLSGVDGVFGQTKTSLDAWRGYQSSFSQSNTCS